MVQFKAAIKKFDKQGEKTGWTYITIPAAVAEKLQPGSKKGFRVKGRLDEYRISMVSLLPMGGGDFIMPLNAKARKEIRKQKGDTVSVQLEADEGVLKPPKELMECLKDEPEAFERFNSIPQWHRNYFTSWIGTAKTEATKTKRIAAIVEAMLRGWNFSQMMKALQQQRMQ